MKLLAALCLGWASAGAVALLVGMPLPFSMRSRHQRPSRAGEGPSASLWLQQAGVRQTLWQFGALCVACAVSSYVVFNAFAGPIVGVVPAAGMGTMPVLFFGRRRMVRLSEAQRAWPDALRDVLTSITSGQSLHQAIVALARGRHGPISNAFGRYPSLSRALGTSAALEIVRSELADPVSDRVIEVLILAAERGGPAVRTILEDLTASIAADLSILNEIETEILESKINARAVVVLPWVALLLLNQGGGPFRDFYSSAGGALVVTIGGLLTVFGWLLIARLSRVPTEQRVFLHRNSA